MILIECLIKGNSPTHGVAPFTVSDLAVGRRVDENELRFY